MLTPLVVGIPGRFGTARISLASVIIKRVLVEIPSLCIATWKPLGVFRVPVPLSKSHRAPVMYIGRPLKLPLCSLVSRCPVVGAKLMLLVWQIPAVMVLRVLVILVLLLQVNPSLSGRLTRCTILLVSLSVFLLFPV